MNTRLESIVLKTTGADSILSQEVIQSLWSGYGKIMRLRLADSLTHSVVVKHVQIPNAAQHPRGWNTNIGHQRKIKSYAVETAWYRSYSTRSLARLPECLAIDTHEDEVLIILEDLDYAGYSIRKGTASWDDIAQCLAWLARFHASYLHIDPIDLWKIGTYWHLDTRPHELAELTDQRLITAAPLIDQRLNNCTYKTLVHGDAKLANFCFARDGGVAAVDFQYVGGGCGMKDVAYFIGSCLSEHECERLEEQILDTYFMYLRMASDENHEALESEWRSMYRVAWADFHRFIKGWSPGHWKINSYSERVTDHVIRSL